MSRTSQRLVSGPAGREWTVRSYRFRRPPWRSFSFDLFPGFDLLAFLFALPLAIVTLLILPALVFLLELPATAVWTLFSNSRFVEAVYVGPPVSRMSWRTSAGSAEAVVDQVTRQLELGYQRIQPHRAEFLGFD